MKKLVWIISILALLWIVKLSYDFYELHTQQLDVTNKIGQLQQENANLNDQVIALKRQMMLVNSTNKDGDSANHLTNTTLASTADDTALVRQQLDLIEFALQQKQYATALEKLNQLEQGLAHYHLSAALKDSLEAVVVKDRNMLKQFVANELGQINKLKAFMQQLDAEIAVEMQHPYQETTHETRSFWQRLIQVESVKQPSTLLMQRSVILKEAQLRLLTAQSALQSGQPLVFAKAIDSVIEVLKQLPDQKTRTWINQLIRIKAIPATPLPMLNTRTLIGE